MVSIGGDEQDVLVKQGVQLATVALATSDVELIIEASGMGPPGPPGADGPPGGAMITGWWDYSPFLAAPPSVGQIRSSPDPAVVGQPMTLWLSATDDSGLYWNAPSIQPGDDIRLRGSAGAVGHFTVTAFEVTAPGPTGYATVQTVVNSVVGQVAKNAKVEATLIRQAPQGPPGPAGADGAPGPAGADGEDGNFRGEWVADSVARTYNFSGGIPAGFTTSVAGTGQTPVGVPNVTGASAGAPGTFTSSVLLRSLTTNGANQSNLNLDLATLGIPNITRATAWFGTVNLGGNYDQFYLGQICANGAPTATTKEPTTWTKISGNVDSNDILTLRGACDSPSNFSVQADIYVAGLEIYATASPYMLGHYVSYQGKLWRSLADNNSATPAEGAYWTSVIYGGPVVVQHGTNGAMARPTAGVVYWVGTATPVNGLPYDFWKDT